MVEIFQGRKPFAEIWLNYGIIQQCHMGIANEAYATILHQLKDNLTLNYSTRSLTPDLSTSDFSTMNFPTPDVSTPSLGLKHPGLESSWLNSPGLKPGVEKSGLKYPSTVVSPFYTNVHSLARVTRSI